MATIKMEIDNCMDCPYHTSQRHYTSDSWEMAFNYFCTKENNKKIAGYVERRSEMGPVPSWCPLREDREEAIAKENLDKINKFQGESI